MAKTTKTPEQLEWEANSERRDQMIYRRLNERWRESERREAKAAQMQGASAWRRRLFPWRLRVERLS
jgi:hypothetical protein